jgi:restriction system protein
LHLPSAAGRLVSRRNGGGTDGIIKEDRLGLDVIHIQAKRWDDKTVGRPDVQSFAGSLDGVRAKKGIFITTSMFSGDARNYVDRIDKRIVLIDGNALAALTFDYGVGVTPLAAYEIKRVDSSFLLGRVANPNQHPRVPHIFVWFAALTHG